MLRITLAALLFLTQLPAFAQTVLFQTNQGNFEVTLAPDKAPKTCENFLRYVQDGSYKGTLFHRVIAGFMIQGGGFNQDWTRQDSYAPVINESDNGLSNQTGTIAMARTNDPDSATRQFFINVHNNSYLDGSNTKPGYTVFGKVTKGMETVTRIAAVTTGTGPVMHMRDVPKKPVVIENVRVIDAK